MRIFLLMYSESLTQTERHRDPVASRPPLLCNSATLWPLLHCYSAANPTLAAVSMLLCYSAANPTLWPLLLCYIATLRPILLWLLFLCYSATLRAILLCGHCYSVTLLLCGQCYSVASATLCHCYSATAATLLLCYLGIWELCDTNYTTVAYPGDMVAFRENDSCHVLKSANVYTYYNINRKLRSVH